MNYEIEIYSKQKKTLYSPETTYYKQIVTSEGYNSADEWRIKMCDKYITDPNIAEIKRILLILNSMDINHALNRLEFYRVNVKSNVKRKIFNDEYNWITGLYISKI